MASLVAGRFGLPRGVRLKRRGWIRALFDREREDVSTVSGGCIRILFRIVDDEPTLPQHRLSVGFSAGSGQRSAVNRNRIKRLLRESFRLNQQTVVDHLPPRGILTMMILYRHHDVKSFERIDRDLRGALKAMASELDKITRHG